ncbi:glycosyltransferase family 2 protein [Nonlabens marinus]|uniref:Glycosyltransferase n=1 Tax=Nonlabens marinus S1-08 TaxID=1454201 RepID=W8VVT9_9FLAO|nr:glycosyltransferase family 2 protein [Nonlabens marinus]BAO55738.1 glycosyltransferase [Nonlabens marinus S1-08]
MSSKVTILLSTFNRAQLIEETLVSIQNQTYQNFECLITDDNSTDSTEKVVNEFCINDSRFTYHRKPRSYPNGLSANRNFGLDLAKALDAKYIQFFDDDDIMHPKKIEMQMMFFKQDPLLEIVGCKFQGFIGDFDLDKHEYVGDMKVQSNDLAWDFLNLNIRLNSGGPIFKFSLLSEFRFDEQLLNFAEETEYYLRVFFIKKPNYAACDNFLFFYRHHQDTNTSTTKNSIIKHGSRLYILDKLYEFIENNQLFESRLYAFFIKVYTIDSYNKEMLLKINKSLITTSHENHISFVKIKKFQFLIWFHRFYRKVFFKISFLCEKG